jgi:hypothetical protein
MHFDIDTADAAAAVAGVGDDLELRTLLDSVLGGDVVAEARKRPEFPEFVRKVGVTKV